MAIRVNLLAGLVLLSAQLTIYGQSDTELKQFQRIFEANNQLSSEESIRKATLRLEQAREIGDGLEIAQALKELGVIQLNGLHDYETAMDYFIRALSIEDSLHLEAPRALTYVAISRVFEVVGDYHKSAEFLQQVLSMNQAERDINSLALIRINLGKVNAAMGKHEEARNSYEAVLRNRGDISNSFEAEALFNLAQLNSLQGDYPKALGHYKEALAISRSRKDRYSEALFLNHIGILYGLMKNEERSLANHAAALEIRKELNDKPGLAESFNNIGWVYYRQNKVEDAISNGVKALENGQEAQAQEQMFKSYELLSQSFKEIGEFQNSLKYKELSLAIYEFIQNERQEKKLLETQNRYVLEKKESQIEKLDAVRRDREKVIAAQKEFRNFLYLVVALILVIALLGFYLYLIKRRSNRILEAAKTEVQRQNLRLQELNQTKDKFFSIISHDLKGPLNSLTSFSHLLIEHTDSMTREEIQMLAKDLDKSVKNLYALLENLLEWSRAQTGHISFAGELLDLTELLETNRNLLEAQAKAKGITLRLETTGPCIISLHKPSIHTVLRNLISNAIKFTPEGGTIRVGLTRDDRHVRVFVADNGLGMSQEIIDKLFRIDQKLSTRGTANEKGTGLGLILCREFVEKNGGKISVASQPAKGSVFSISFPAHKCQNRPEVAEPATIS